VKHKYIHNIPHTNEPDTSEENVDTLEMIAVYILEVHAAAAVDTFEVGVAVDTLEVGVDTLEVGVAVDALEVGVVVDALEVEIAVDVALAAM